MRFQVEPGAFLDHTVCTPIPLYSFLFHIIIIPFYLSSLSPLSLSFLYPWSLSFDLSYILVSYSYFFFSFSFIGYPTLTLASLLLLSSSVTLDPVLSGWTGHGVRPWSWDRIRERRVWSFSELGMGTRRPGTRQDLGPGTSRGLAEESRDFLYITQPCINIGRLII